MAFGAIDTTFGNAGKVILNVNFKGLDVDSTGRIYVLTTNTAGTILLRFSAAGKLDTTYATGGTALVASPSANFNPTALAIQSDGKALVAGTVSTNSDDGAKARIYRLTTAGAPDTSSCASARVDAPL